MKIDKRAAEVITVLKNNGYTAGIVGGAVRDYLLGIEPNDFDIATSATPEIIESLFRTIPLKDDVTTRVVIDGKMVEVVTFNDGHLNTSDLETDLERRDFTINAMYYNGSSIIDRCGGTEDANKKMIRFVGCGHTKVEEDPIRVLRAIRFAIKLNFKISETTKSIILKDYMKLERVSKERIAKEFVEILKGKNLSLLKEYKEILSLVCDKIEWTDEIIDRLENKTLKERLIVLTLVQKEEFVKNMRLSSVQTISKGFLRDINEISKYINKESFGEIAVCLNGNKELFEELLTLKVKDNNMNIDVNSFVNEMFESFGYKIIDLNLKAPELISLGYRGKEIKSTLEMMLLKVANKEIKNDKEELLKLLNK